jgi:hypothetical protein
LEQAAKLAPDFPENQLNLAESYLEWRENDSAKKALRAVDALWPKAQGRLVGDDWAQSWQDWSRRREAVRHKLSTPDEPVTPPKLGR